MKRYKGYRFPIEVISSAIWSYYRLTASFRDIEILLMQWLLSKEFRRETDAVGLEMMELLDEPEEARAERLAANEPYTMLYKLNPEAEAPSDVVTDLGEYHENAFTSIPQQQPVSGSLLTPDLQPGQRRRFAEPWDAWRKRVREKAAK